MLGIRNLTKRRPPRLPYLNIANQVLGRRSKFEVSLTFIGPTRSRELNQLYRSKRKPANILTFPLSKNQGEILIDLTTAEAEARRQGINFSDYFLLIFIHGLLHLKGLPHGSRMESLEENYCHRFGRRHRRSQGRGLRDR